MAAWEVAGAWVRVCRRGRVAATRVGVHLGRCWLDNLNFVGTYMVGIAFCSSESSPAECWSSLGVWLGSFQRRAVSGATAVLNVMGTPCEYPVRRLAVLNASCKASSLAGLHERPNGTLQHS